MQIALGGHEHREPHGAEAEDVDEVGLVGPELPVDHVVGRARLPQVDHAQRLRHQKDHHKRVHQLKNLHVGTGCWENRDGKMGEGPGAWWTSK